jgi:hypothetical protein
MAAIDDAVGGVPRWLPLLLLRLATTVRPAAAASKGTGERACRPRAAGAEP